MPTTSEIYVQAVNCHQGGKLAQAESLYRQVIVLNPGHVGAHNNLGVVFMDQGKPNEAIACYREALRLNPNYANAHNNLGNAFKEQGQLTEAAACFAEAL